MHEIGSAEGQSPFAGGTGVSPVLGFVTPFLAGRGTGGWSKGSRGTDARGRAAEVLRPSPFKENGTGRYA